MFFFSASDEVLCCVFGCQKGLHDTVQSHAGCACEHCSGVYASAADRDSVIQGFCALACSMSFCRCHEPSPGATVLQARIAVNRFLKLHFVLQVTSWFLPGSSHPFLSPSLTIQLCLIQIAPKSSLLAGNSRREVPLLSMYGYTQLQTTNGATAHLACHQREQNVPQ